ncbi:FeoB-associated Cys-rich membrane protein [Helicobacter sp. 16-1353]|nr:FeoB-associated Cys-rich membrane protein [Helicobacter sp. 16-1353]
MEIFIVLGLAILAGIYLVYSAVKKKGCGCGKEGSCCESKNAKHHTD